MLSWCDPHLTGSECQCKRSISKSLGQILRVRATMHVLFHLSNNDPLPSTITDEAIAAAIDFVDVCCQHTAFISGRGRLHENLVGEG